MTNKIYPNHVSKCRIGERTEVCRLTPLGRRRVTRVMPSTCFRPSLAMAFLAFFSLREWIATVDPAGIEGSPLSTSTSDSSEEVAASSTSTVFLTGSSGSSSMRELDMLAGVPRMIGVGVGGRRSRGLPQRRAWVSGVEMRAEVLSTLEEIGSALENFYNQLLRPTSW